MEDDNVVWGTDFKRRLSAEEEALIHFAPLGEDLKVALLKGRYDPTPCEYTAPADDCA